MPPKPGAAAGARQWLFFKIEHFGTQKLGDLVGHTGQYLKKEVAHRADQVGVAITAAATTTAAAAAAFCCSAGTAAAAC